MNWLRECNEKNCKQIDDDGKPNSESGYGGLCFTAEQANSTVALNKSSTSAPTITLQYSTDAENWIDYTWNSLSGTVITLANVGDKVWFRAGEGGNTTFASLTSNYHKFVMSGKIAASGNIMSLLDRTMESKTLRRTYTFFYLFNGCTSLTQAPALPATTLADCCYQNMFQNCTSLTQAPALPATTLATYCYQCMFSGCTSLTQAPALPATTLIDRCYYQMFSGCTSLTQAPALPATTLATYCYYYMFRMCSNLKISQNGSTGTKILDLTSFSSLPSNATTYMFSNTGGTFKGTPTVGNSYWNYT